MSSGDARALHVRTHTCPARRTCDLFDTTLGALTAGVLALGLHYGSYCSEVYRAGLENIPRRQCEASIALNLSPYHTFRDVIIPQAIPPVVPALEIGRASCRERVCQYV